MKIFSWKFFKYVILSFVVIDLVYFAYSVTVILMRLYGKILFFSGYKVVNLVACGVNIVFLIIYILYLKFRKD